MSLRINHNIAAVNGHRNMIKNDMMVSKSLEKLSSGLRINKAADDAAGLVISEQMRAQLGGLNQAVANTEQAVTLVQTAEGALDEMNTLLSKARTLAVHAANAGVNDTNQLAADQSELTNIVDSVDRIANNTQFGTKKILDGTLSNSQILDKTVATSFTSSGIATGNLNVSVVTSAVVATAVSASLTDANAAGIFNTIAAGASVSLASTFKAATTLSFSASTDGKTAAVNVTVAAGDTLQNALTALNSAASKNGVGVSLVGVGFKISASDVGTYSNGINFSISGSGFNATSANLAAGADTTVKLTDASDNDAVGANLTSTRGTTVSATSGTKSVQVTLSQATAIGAAGTKSVSALAVSGGATFQIGANAGQTASISLSAVTATTLGRNSAVTSNAASTSFQDLKTSNWLTSGRADDAIKVIDKAIDDVTNARGKLGAFQANTLETNTNSLRVSMENLTAAESTIRDVDFAAESAQFTKNNILVQASTAMMAQANQLPQAVLKLLG